MKTHHHFGEGSYEQSEMIIQELLTEAGIGGIERELVSVDYQRFHLQLICRATINHGVSQMDTVKILDEINQPRRRFFGTAAMAVAATQLGMIGPAAAQRVETKMPAIKPGTNTSFGPVKQINAGVLNVGYAETGPANGPVVVLLHGWPYDIHSFVDVAPMLAGAGYRVIVPYLRGYGATRFLSSETARNGQPSALAVDVITLLDALKIEKPILAGFDWGARTANIVAALWPERCKAMVSVSGYLIGNQEAGKMPLPPKAELEWWYQFYFATERGRAGYEKYRNEFSKLIWQLASPKWEFDDATFDRTATAFDNPDQVDIVIHNYRWRLGLAKGEPRYDDLEKRLAESPVVTVPTITLEGDANGAPHPDPNSYAKKFVGKYSHRLIGGGIGHNLAQEAPQAFAEAVVDVAKA
jgi:pimeloyl-ACP methyl ester carboxylesterase